MKTKTRKFLIATHGALAGGFRSSLELIAGGSDAVFILEAYLAGSKPLEEELDSLFQSTEEDEEWVVFSDLLGGSITNQLVRAASRAGGGEGMGQGKDESAGKGASRGESASIGVGTNIHIVAGFNLPLLIEVVLSDPETPIEAVLEQAIARAREQLVYVNQLITFKNNDSEDA